MERGLVELIVDKTRVEFKRELILPNLSEKLNRGRFYKFDINGYIIFPLGESILLFNDERSSSPIACIEIIRQTNYLLGGKPHTQGEYYVKVCKNTK